MTDQRTIEILAPLYPPFAERVMRVFCRSEAELGLQMRAIEGCRCFARSTELVAEGKLAAPAGLCIHNYAAAIDAGFVGTDPYLDKLRVQSPAKYRGMWIGFARLCVEENLRAGADFKKPDLDHCELPGLDPHKVFAIYQAGGMSAVWTYFDELLGLPVGCTWAGKPLFDPKGDTP